MSVEPVARYYPYEIIRDFLNLYPSDLEAGNPFRMHGHYYYPLVKNLVVFVVMEHGAGHAVRIFSHVNGGSRRDRGTDLRLGSVRNISNGISSPLNLSRNNSLPLDQVPMTI